MNAPRIFDRALLTQRRNRAADRFTVRLPLSPPCPREDGERVEKSLHPLPIEPLARMGRGRGEEQPHDGSNELQCACDPNEAPRLVAIDPPDFLLRRVADDLIDRLSAVTRAFETALDLGCHHGLLGRALRDQRGIATVVSADAAPAMLRHADGLRVGTDEETLPFRDGAFDLVVSGLSLQHVDDLPGTLAQVRRILKPDGLLLASLLGGATLHELREAFLVAETECEGGVGPRVAPFADVRDLGGLLQRAGFALPVVDADTVIVAYQSPLHLMHDLRAMGATSVLAERPRRPLSRATLARACAVYAERFSRPDGRVLATFEILTLTAWAPDASQPKPLRPGSATTRLADVLGVPERKAP